MCGNLEHKHLLKTAQLELKKSKRKDYYKVLGVAKNATEDEIKKAYRKRALMHHPGLFSWHSECKNEFLKKYIYCIILVVSSNFFFAGIIGQIATALLLQRCRRRRKRSSRRWARPSLYSLTQRRRSAMTMDMTWMTMAALVEEVNSVFFSSSLVRWCGIILSLRKTCPRCLRGLHQVNVWASQIAIRLPVSLLWSCVVYTAMMFASSWCLPHHPV